MWRKPAMVQKNGAAASMKASLPMLQLATGGRVPRVPKKLDQSLWDTEYLAVSAVEQTVRFFTSLSYQNGPLAGTAKTRQETNLDTEGQLPSPQSFSATAIQMSVIHDASGGLRPSLADLEQLRAHSYVQFMQGSKPVWRMRTEKLAGPGLHVMRNATSGVEVLNLGTVPIIDFHKLGFRIGIRDGYTFSVELFASDKCNIDAPLRLRCKLIGHQSRSLR